MADPLRGPVDEPLFAVVPLRLTGSADAAGPVVHPRRALSELPRAARRLLQVIMRLCRGRLPTTRMCVQAAAADVAGLRYSPDLL
jgi:hypothetical protein